MTGLDLTPVVVPPRAQADINADIVPDGDAFLDE